MSRTNIDLDDKACRAVMARYGFATKREAVNFALRTCLKCYSLDGSSWGCWEPPPQN
jgi:Arc/MetJ family transcription regulator